MAGYQNTVTRVSCNGRALGLACILPLARQIHQLKNPRHLIIVRAEIADGLQLIRRQPKTVLFPLRPALHFLYVGAIFSRSIYSEIRRKTVC
jgi:hypothetical protein